MIPGLGRCPVGGHGNPLQYSCLENPHGQRSLVGYSLWDHWESDTTEQLSKPHIWLYPESSATPYIQGITLLYGFPGGTSSKESTCQCRRCNRCWFNPWVGKIPWSRKWHPTPIFLPGESHEQRSLEGYRPWGCKALDPTERAHMRAWACTHTHTHTHSLLHNSFHKVQWRINEKFKWPHKTLNESINTWLK